MEDPSAPCVVHTMRILDHKRARETDDDRDHRGGTPGRSTLTSRLPPTARSIAREVTRQLQARGDLAGPDAHETAAYGLSGAGSALPFFDQIQQAFGHHDISGVRAHIGGVAGDASSALGARAYASGDAVAFASSPDLHLAAHEAAHVVQQRGGVRLAGGLGRSGDEYEVNADAVADRVVRGVSAQDLLDPFSHRGSSGGPAVQRGGHDGARAGVQDLDRMALRGRPTPHEVVACMRRHPDDARAILARVRERFGDARALEVEVEVGMTAPELVPVLGSSHARGTSPVGRGSGGGSGLGPVAPPRAPSAPPVELRGGDDGVTASVRPDAHSTIEATVGAGETSPELREVRVVVSDAAPGGTASAALEVGADLEAGRGRASLSGELAPDGEGGPTLSANASVSVGSGEEGGVDVRGSGSLELRVPVGDHVALREALVITDDGHLRVEAGADLVRRVRRLPDDNAAREPLLRLFMTVDSDLRTGERTASGGASLEVQFDREGDDHDDPGEAHQLARSGTSGAGSSLPHLAQIQRAFGHHDVSGVRAHVGDAATAATGAMGARGYAYGDDVAFAAAPDLRLAAHEAAHVVQQRGGVRLSGGVGRSGDAYEQHADAVAELVVRGESAQALLDERAHRGATGGPAVQRTDEEDRAWLATTLHDDGAGHYTHADGSALSAPERRRLRRVLGRLSGGASRGAPAARPDTVERHERVESSHTGTALETTELDEERDARASAAATSDIGRTEGGPRDSASGGRRRRMGRLADDSHARIDTIDETRRRETGGTAVERHEEGTRALRVGPDRAAADVHDELERRVAELDTRIAATTNRAERARLTTERGRLASDLETLAEPDVPEADVARLATRHRMGDVLEEDVTSTTTSTDRNPLDGTVGDATERARDVRDLDGSSARHVERRSRTYDLAEGTHTVRTEDELSSTAADGGSMTERSSRTTRLEAGGGHVGRSVATGTESEVRHADGSTERRADETSSSAGAIISEDETGGRVGGTARRERASGGTTTVGEASGAVEVTDRRVGGSGSVMGSASRGGITGTARVSGDGSFSIDITPMEDGSGRFRLTFTIHLGVSGSGSLGAADTEGELTGSASLAGRASARGDLITSRVIDEAEARRYLDAADRADAGERVDEPAEFGRLSRLEAGLENADTLMNTSAVFGDGATAAAMVDGESVTLDTEVGLGATASASLTGTSAPSGASLGGSAEVGGDTRWRRTVQVERITIAGEARMRLTVTYREENESHTTGTLTSSVAAARGRLAEETGATDAVQFVIDPNAPDYDARYAAIVGTTDRDELRALEAAYAEDVRRSRHADTAADETEYELGPTSSAMIGTRTRVTGTDDVTVVSGADGVPSSLEATIEGGTDSDVRLRAGSHDIDLGGHRETARGTVDATHGARVDIEAAEESIDPLAAVADGRRALAEADSLRDDAALVLAHSPAEHLRNAFREFGDVWGYHLDEADLSAMSTRAADASRWSACCIVPDASVLRAWRVLASALRHPRPDAAEAAVDRDAAGNIARIRALTAWMRAADSHGAACIERVLRRWGESTTHEATEERLGEGYEWPVSLRHEHASYTELVTQIGDMRARFERALSRAEGDTEAADHHERVSTGLDAVLSAVRSSSDFRSEARRSEMIQDIERQRAEVRARYQDFVRRWRELHHGGHDTAPTAAEVAETRATSAEIMEVRSREYVNAGVRTCRDNHARETGMLQRVQAIMRDAGDSTLVGHGARAEAATLCSEIHDLHRSWFQQVQDLRQAYTQAGIAESEWRVSTGPGTERHRDLEPNVGWLIIEYSRVMQHSYDPYWQHRVEEWREESRAY